jgi:NAD(P)-dependent dehydrogenase (short-subunit alcohol dehydrogenase family)
MTKVSDRVNLRKLTDTMESMKNVVITGGSRGIGHATVKLFHDAGWRVFTCSSQSFDSRCTWSSGLDTHIKVDLADEKKTELAIVDIKNKLNGKLHALINNAGASPKSPNGARLNVLSTDLEEWHRVFSLNFFAPLLMARGLRDELASVGGAVVNITSIAGSRVHPFAGAAYATSKAALTALTREMAYDFGPLGVRVNSVAPGEVETDIISIGTDQIVSNLPLRRIGQPEDVANGIFFLCSSNSSYMNGSEISINGGQDI